MPASVANLGGRFHTLAMAASLEGHADDATAAQHGGLTSVVEREMPEPLAFRTLGGRQSSEAVPDPLVSSHGRTL